MEDPSFLFLVIPLSLLVTALAYLIVVGIIVLAVEKEWPLLLFLSFPAGWFATFYFMVIMIVERQQQ
jgi:hypothetical protein